MRPFLGNGTLHEQHEKSEQNANHRKYEKAIEIGKCRGLLLPQVIKRLQGHLLRSGRVSSLLQEEGPSLLQEGIYGWIEQIEVLVESQDMELLAALSNSLPQRSADTAPFIAQQRQETYGRSA